MINLNLTNIITIGIISVAAFALVKVGSQAIGFSPAWL